MISVDSMSLWGFVCSVFLCFSVRKNMSFSLCHYVILSSKNICFSSSLCYSVFKKTSVSLRPSVILSYKNHQFLSVPLLFCLQDHPFCLSCPHVTLSSKLPCPSLPLGHYVGRQRIQNLDKTVQKNRKEGVPIMTHPLLLCYYLEEEISSQRPFHQHSPSLDFGARQR